MKKPIIKKQALDPSSYVNPETGETISSELTNSDNDRVKLTRETNTDYFIIDSKEYVIIDSKGLLKVASILGEVELAKVIKMADCVRTPFNILYEDSVPHTPESLSTYLDYNIDNFYKLIKKLVKKGIMAYIVCAPSGYVKKVYMLNPTLARKGKKFHAHIEDVFPDFSK